LSVENNPAYLRVERMAVRLSKKLKSEKQIEMTKEQCFNFLAEHNEVAKNLLRIDKLLRLGAAAGTVPVEPIAS
jgi:hypothetical protein